MSMNGIQRNFIKYADNFAHNNSVHIWLGGSFLYGGYTAYSDIDISILGKEDVVNKFIYGYGEPVYISYTSNPQGILIVIYSDGVALDLEIVDEINILDDNYFHREDIKELNYVRETNLCTSIALCNDVSYQISRLFHRSLIKFLSGKRKHAINVINEVITFMDSQDFIEEENYHNRVLDVLKKYDVCFHLPIAYYEILCRLIKELVEY